MYGVEGPVPGVKGMDHTADVGLDVRAPDLSELFRRAALGAIWLVLERPAGPGKGTEAEGVEGGLQVRTVNLVEEDLGALLRSWLRLVLLWAEMEDFVLVDGRFTVLPVPLCSSPGGHAFGLEGNSVGVVDSGPRAREVKGVTLHGLRVERIGEEWFGRVVLDV